MCVLKSCLIGLVALVVLGDPSIFNPGQIAQTGFRCWTAIGHCPTPPQPVGSACSCGAAAGIVVE